MAPYLFSCFIIAKQIRGGQIIFADEILGKMHHRKQSKVSAKRTAVPGREPRHAIRAQSFCMFFSKIARVFSRILRKASSKWAKDFDLMIRRDKIDADDIAEVIDWSQNDNFWRSNILSGKKVREKYQQLRMRMKSIN